VDKNEVLSALYDIVERALENPSLQEAHDIFEDAWLIMREVKKC